MAQQDTLFNFGKQHVMQPLSSFHGLAVGDHIILQVTKRNGYDKYYKPAVITSRKLTSITCGNVTISKKHLHSLHPIAFVADQESLQQASYSYKISVLRRKLNATPWHVDFRMPDDLVESIGNIIDQRAGMPTPDECFAWWQNNPDAS